MAMRYAANISLEKHDGYTLVRLKDPWHAGRTLHEYVLVKREDSAHVGRLPQGTVVYTPLRRAVVFNTAHAGLMQMLGVAHEIAGVADAKYMLLPDIRKRVGRNIVDCGDGMKPDVEKIIDLRADAILLSPFENSGGYGDLEKTGVPIIECAEYMETSPLGRAEWMRFYGMLFGCGQQAEKLFASVETNYNKVKAHAQELGKGRKVIADRLTGNVWYLPGGRSTVAGLYRDAGGSYAYDGDSHSGSLQLSAETVIDRMADADCWILTCNGRLTRSMLLADYPGYRLIKAFREGEVYACSVDEKPYFEEVSWRPDWLLNDLVQLFHPHAMKHLRYYKKIE